MWFKTESSRLKQNERGRPYIESRHSKNVINLVLKLLGFNSLLRADFWEGDEESNFSIFRVRRFSEWPGPLH